MITFGPDAVFQQGKEMLKRRVLSVLKSLVGSSMLSIALLFPALAAEDVYFGVTVSDPWRWLEDAHSPAVRAWIQEQQARALQRLAATDGRTAQAERLRRWIYRAESSVPVEENGRLFFSRASEHQEQPVYYG